MNSLRLIASSSRSTSATARSDGRIDESVGYQQCFGIFTLGCFHQFPLLARLIFDNVSRDRAGRDSQRTRQVHLPGAATAGKITVLCADHHLLWSRGHAWSSVDASAAARLNHFRSSLLENVEITFAHAVVTGL